MRVRALGPLRALVWVLRRAAALACRVNPTGGYWDSAA